MDARDGTARRATAPDRRQRLLRALFSLERHWPPYADRLEPYWTVLHPQGWGDRELQDALLAITRTAAPQAQLALEARVATLMRARGFGTVLDDWGGDIETAKDWYR